MRRALRMQYEAGVRGLATLMLPAQHCSDSQPSGGYGDAGHWLAVGGSHLCLCILLHSQEGPWGASVPFAKSMNYAPSCFVRHAGLRPPTDGARS